MKISLAFQNIEGKRILFKKGIRGSDVIITGCKEGKCRKLVRWILRTFLFGIGLFSPEYKAFQDLGRLEKEWRLLL